MSITPKGDMLRPQFFKEPIQYFRWASREKPALLWSCVIGATGPVFLFGVPPIRYRLGDKPIPPVPMTYPSMKFECCYMASR